MTREEAVNHIKDVICESNSTKPNIVTFEQEKEALEMAIKALEQESILDKVRAEIDELDVLKFSSGERIYKDEVLDIIDKYRAESEPLTPDMLADSLMEERIRGELKQDVTYSKGIVDGVRCELTVEIIDHRPSYCGTELKEVWR